METVPQAPGSQARSSSGSVRPHGSRTANPDKQISQIEKSVTHLLVATKQLLETLTQWSRGNAQEEEVSDVYVRLGYEFNLACRAFNSIQVETNDLGPVPDLLRAILEDTLSQPASPQALDNYLPRIRDIIINLLHGLKRKQSKLRSRPAKDGLSKALPAPARQTSVTSVQTNETNLETALDNMTAQPVARSDSRLETLRYTDEPQTMPDSPRTTSLNRNSVNRPNQRVQQRHLNTPDSGSSNTAAGVSTFPAIEAPFEPDRDLTQTGIHFPHAPPPPPKQDALTALQRGPDLERRASRRFSAYQIQKHLGGSPNGVPVIPASQHSPIPNRGREAKESLTAVRSRTSFTTKRSATRLQEISPSRSDTINAPQRISEERDDDPRHASPRPARIELPTEPSGSYSPTVKTPDEYFGSGGLQPIPTMNATLNGPMSPALEYQHRVEPEIETGPSKTVVQDVVKSEGVRKPSLDVHPDSRYTQTPSPTAGTSFNTTPPQGKDLTLFLQYKSKIKKFVLGDGFEGLTMARLQLAFIEKFNWNTHNNGVDLPEIYIQDPVSGVRHELEDMADIRDRCVLVLNVEVLDEVKKHFDESMGGIKTTLESVRSLLDGQGSMLQRFSDRQLETSKEMARLSTTPMPRPTRALTGEMSPVGAPPSSESSLAELQLLRRDIAVLRQTYSTMSTDFAATMSDIKTKAAVVKQAAAAAVAPSYEGDAGRAHVNQGKKQLSTESETLVTRVDDLTDLVEDLRKDVVTRGVRPLPRQLEDISKDITTTNRKLTKMKEFLKREKPIWTKIWEKELDQVCTERDDLTQQEELVSDLDGDLQDVTGVFKLVEEAMKQQALHASGNSRNSSKAFEYDPSIDPQAVKDGLLGEVRALKVNHEDRLEAIERAEKARLKELESRSEGEFQREVKEFVEEGKLKKTGGMDEVERLRKVRDERAMKENWERKAAREAEREQKRQAEAAAKAAAAESTAREQEKHSNATANEENPTSTAMTETLETSPDKSVLHDERFSTSNIHQATTLPFRDQNSAPLSSSQETTVLSLTETERKYDSGPPQLPEVKFGNPENHRAEEVKLAATGESKTASKDTAKDNSWWKPAVF